MRFSFWQGAFFLASAAFLAWEVWRGWRAGVVRSGLKFAALLASGLLGWLAGKWAAEAFGGLGNAKGLLAGCVVGGSLGVSLLVIACLFGAALFKRTGQQRFGIIHALWGMGGAFFGLLIGLAIFGVSFWALFGFGVFANPHPATAGGLSGPASLKVSTLKKTSGGLAASNAPVRPGFYDLALQIGKVTSDRKTMARFLEYPGIQELLQSPRIAALANDPAVVRASKERSVLWLLNDEAVAAAFTDPAVAEQLRKIDLQKALKFALESPPSPDSPLSQPKKRK
jgi:hypothetical protein